MHRVTDDTHLFIDKHLLHFAILLRAIYCRVHPSSGQQKRCATFATIIENHTRGRNA